jgi:GNAT superfamily N-acetyltransferase
VAELRWDWAVGNGHGARVSRTRFAEDFQRWCDVHQASHLCVVGLDAGDAVVAFGFVALTQRVPAPNQEERWSADVQAVFVTPTLRNGGVGGQLIDQLVRLAREQGAEHVTVHSSPGAVTAYERAGFQRDPLMLNQLL